MKTTTYPTGVENHGGFLRIWFMYQNKRYRETLGLPDTARNRKAAGELRQSIVYAIRLGNFDYAKQFPDSTNGELFATTAIRDITVADLIKKYMSLKQPELTLNAYTRYLIKLETCCQIVGPARMASSIRSVDILHLRNELLLGQHRPARNRKVIKSGRSVATVNDYLTCMKGVFKFATANGYLVENPGDTVNKLKRSKVHPDPLTREEFERLTAACLNEQTLNLWTIALYTGLRHGELCAVAWEDVDLAAGELMVRRNWTSVKQYTLPKTDAGVDRVIQLLEPALSALKRQQALTRFGSARDITVLLREHGKTRTDRCTFIFDPGINAKGKGAGDRYTPSSIGDSWDRTLKRAKLRHRNAYQSRHTYACWLLSAGANPAFIANQMGHASAQMVFNVYGDWIPDQNAEQIELLNAKLGKNAPSMPHKRSGT